MFLLCVTGAGQRKGKGGKSASTAVPLAPPTARFGEGAPSASGGLTLRDPVTGAQYVQIQLLQVNETHMLVARMTLAGWLKTVHFGGHAGCFIGQRSMMSGGDAYWMTVMTVP